MAMELSPSPGDVQRRKEVLGLILEFVQAGKTIRMPDLHAQEKEAAPFDGSVGPYQYRFEGEEDLLHLSISRVDGSPLTPEEARSVAAFILNGLPPALVLLKPGMLSQHFYVGHDFLIEHLSI